MSPISDRSLSSLKTPTQWQPRREDKGPGREGKGGKLQWESSSSSCSRANFVLTLREHLNLHWQHPCPSSPASPLTPLICPGQTLQGSSAASASRPTGNSSVFPAPASESVPTSSCRRKGGLREGKPPPAAILIASSTFQNTKSSSLGILKINSSSAVVGGGNPFSWTEIWFAALRDAGTAPKGLGIAWRVCSAKALIRIHSGTLPSS